MFIDSVIKKNYKLHSLLNSFYTLESIGLHEAEIPKGANRSNSL